MSEGFFRISVGLEDPDVLCDVFTRAVEAALSVRGGRAMGDDVLGALLAAFPLPTLAIDASERIVAANVEALTLIGQQALDRNYVTMLRQPCTA